MLGFGTQYAFAPFKSFVLWKMFWRSFNSYVLLAKCILAGSVFWAPLSGILMNVHCISCLTLLLVLEQVGFRYQYPKSESYSVHFVLPLFLAFLLNLLFLSLPFLLLWWKEPLFHRHHHSPMSRICDWMIILDQLQPNSFTWRIAWKCCNCYPHGK